MGSSASASTSDAELGFRCFVLEVSCHLSSLTAMLLCQTQLWPHFLETVSFLLPILHSFVGL